MYFTGTIDESKRQKLRIRDRPNFRVELRDSPVLILSMKGRPQLTIDEVHEIINISALREKLPLIQMIAVGGQTNAKSRHVAHAYLQFCDAATARECVNSVDALPFKDGYVHSPQIDMQSLQESMQGRAVVWNNPNYCPPASSAKLGLASLGLIKGTPPRAAKHAVQNAQRDVDDHDSVPDQDHDLSAVASSASDSASDSAHEVGDYFVAEGGSGYDDEMLASFF